MQTKKNTIFLDACFRKKTPRTPVWFMRQAGRIFPEYRRMREKYGILTLARTPELASRITLMPVSELGVDAAILFADITLVLLAMNVELDIKENIGPVMKHPVRTLGDIRHLSLTDPEESYAYLGKTIGILRKELAHSVPLIGFAGAPFTLASYLIEGRPSRGYEAVKRFMYMNPKGWKMLMEKLTHAIIAYLVYQIEAGVEAVQLFDSWAGCLAPIDYERYVLPYSQKIFRALQKYRVPRIHFGTGTAGFLESFAHVDCEIIGVDWRIEIGEAWRRIGYQKAVQGNLDPAVLCADWPSIKKKTDEIFTATRGRRGHIFNLGHGVLPDTPLASVKRLVEYAKRH